MINNINYTENYILNKIENYDKRTIYLLVERIYGSAN